jgi:hypothetical protein
MRASGRSAFTFAAATLLLATAACKKPAPPPQDESAAAPAPAPPAAPKEFSVSGIEVGKGLSADKRVTTPATTFAPSDTIYASVATDGAAPSKVITAKWTFQSGQTVKETSDTIAPTGPAATEFHIAKKSGWPVGKYKVEILVDGSSAGSKDFEVKK